MSHPGVLLSCSQTTYLGKRYMSLIVFRHKFHQTFCLWDKLLGSQSWLIWKNSLELNRLIQNNVQQDYLLSLYLPTYQKTAKCKWFWLIIAEYLHFKKGMSGGVVSFFQKYRGEGEGGGFSPQTERFFSESNLWLLLLLEFVNPKNFTI